MNSPNEIDPIARIAALAARAERTRLAPGRRTRILAEARSRQAWGVPAWAKASMAAAALLAVLAVPAVLIEKVPGDQQVGEHSDMNLQVSLQGDRVILEWENGQPVHTVKVATSPREMAKVNGIKVEGRRYVDTSRQDAEIVYYQID
ncbi:MAG: hypothetical protein ACREAA_08710 [Candidatus Polarisedimenticolia bacterium]